MPWVARDGDHELRFKYDLNIDSVVYDVGGYLGEWAEPLYKKYGCKIEIFEPMPKFVNILQSKFQNNKSINIYPYGLSNKSKSMLLSDDSEASSVFKASDTQQRVKLRRVSTSLQHPEIDLMKMNIEGGEYELLDDLIKTGKIATIKNLHIQFHDFVPGSEKLREKIQKKLLETHYPTYIYRFIWENWRRYE